MARRDRGASGVALDDMGGGLALDTLADPGPLTGPHDGDDLDPEVTEALGCVDFGAIRVPVPARGKVTVEPTANGRMQAVHIAVPEGRLSVSALAAPKSSTLWPELSREIEASLRDGGATVRSFSGHWGRELHATSGGATSVFVGVDGPRWMLYGVATGPSTHAEALDGELRRVLRGTVVVRGKSPYPVRTILPLVVPEHLAEAAAEQAGDEAAGGKAARKAGARKPGARKSPAEEPAQKSAQKSAQEAAREAAQKKAVLDAARKKAAQKKAAQRRAAQERAVQERAVQERAVQERAVQERAVEERAAQAEAARTAGTGAYPAATTISTGPGRDAPLREQAPSARRAAAASWRSRPAVPEADGPSPAGFDGLPPAGLPPADGHPADAGPGGRRRLREPGTGAQPPVGGRRRLREPLDEEHSPAAAPEPVSGGRRRLRDEPAPAASVDPGPAQRRRPHEPDPLLGTVEAPARRRLLGDPPAAEPATTATGRRHLREPHAAATGSFGADRFGDPAAGAAVSGTGRRSLREPVADAGGVSETGRRALREPGAAEVSGTGRRHLREPGAGVPDVSATGRRHLREPDAGVADVSATGRRHLREPDAGVADVSATGRRHLREPDAGADVSGTGRRALRGPGADGSDVSGTGRRALREPGPGVADVSGTGRRHLRGPDAGVAEVSRTGRRHLQEPAVPSAPAGTRQPAPQGGRRSRREPDLPAVDVPTAAVPGIDAWSPSGPAATTADAWDTAGTSGGSAGRRARPDESDPTRWDRPADPLDTSTALPWSGEPAGWGGAVEATAESAPVPPPGDGRPWDGPVATPAAGSRPGGRRRRREPDPVDEWAGGLGGMGGAEQGWSRPDEQPWNGDSSGAPAGGGGRRRRRAAPEPGGAPTEPWLLEPEPSRPDEGRRRDPDRGGRRTLGSEYLIETGEQDPSWAAFLDRFTADTQVRPGGRHATGGSADAPPTERLHTLRDDIDPGRSRGRHHREP